MAVKSFSDKTLLSRVLFGAFLQPIGMSHELRSITSCSCPVKKPLFVSPLKDFQIRLLSDRTDVEDEPLKVSKMRQKMIDFRIKLGMRPRDDTYYMRRAVVLYEAIDKVNTTSFFKAYPLEDTFFSWFRIAELHIWMIMVRVSAEGEEGKFLNKCIMQYMWEDMRRRAKALTTDNIASAVNTGLQTLHQEMVVALLSYDEALQGSDTVLAGALWNRFLLKNCDNPESVEKLVKYVRIQIQHLDSISRDDFLHRGKLTWVPYVDRL